jgi:hypothetical protein
METERQNSQDEQNNNLDTNSKRQHKHSFPTYGREQINQSVHLASLFKIAAKNRHMLKPAIS